jgi:hypothetical protein
LYYIEKWIIKARDARRLTAAEMKYMRRTARHTWTDYKTNKEMVEELNITPLSVKIQDYRRNWLQHIKRLPRNSLPRTLKIYRPTGRKNQWRPLKILLDV